MVKVPFVILNNGQRCPHLGLNVIETCLNEVQATIKSAIDVGYRHLDCSVFYNYETEIGKAVREKIDDGTVCREELFIVSKFQNLNSDQVVLECKQSLDNIGLDYFDLYLLHYPVVKNDYDFLNSWREMEECVRHGYTKSIGFSNFDSRQIERILQNAHILPVMNQIEISPNSDKRSLITFCINRGLQVTAQYTPFESWTNADQIRLDDAKLVLIGKKYGKNSAQVIFRYLIQLGAIPIAKSSNTKQLQENLSVFDFELSYKDMAVIDGFSCKRRYLPATEFYRCPFELFKN